MVVVRFVLMSGGIVITGTIVCMFEMNVSLTSEVMSLRIQLQGDMQRKYVDLPTPWKRYVSLFPRKKRVNIPRHRPVPTDQHRRPSQPNKGGTYNSYFRRHWIKLEAVKLQVLESLVLRDDHSRLRSPKELICQRD